MNTRLPSVSKGLTGVEYWRSLDEVANTPEFRSWVEREFPEGAGEWTDPVSRRHFMKIMSASFLFAGIGLTGCRRPVEYIYPFGKMPVNYTYGVPQHYATAMPTRGTAIPLVVKSYDGRPIKIEGNRQHPDSNGGTDLFAQASILNLYDPDRAQRFTHGGNNATRESAMDFLTSMSKVHAKTGGQGLCFLVERSSSPSRARLQGLIQKKFPKAKWFVYEAVDFDYQRAIASQDTGKPVRPYYRLEAAKVILSLDNDFSAGEEEAYRMIAGFSKGRRLTKPSDTMSRLYIVEGLASLTGGNADHRLRVPTSIVPQVSAAIALEVFKSKTGFEDWVKALGPLAAAAPHSKWMDQWYREAAKDLLANAGHSLVLAGYRQPEAVHHLAHALNFALGNVGKSVEFLPEPGPTEGGLAALAKELNGGAVETLVIVGGNPVYNAPADLNWAQTQRKAKTVVRLGYYEDETFPVCDWHFPAAHYLESWGDARTYDGTYVPLQPLIQPLFGGLDELDFLARAAGLKTTSAYAMVRATFKEISPGNRFEEDWKKFLHDGFLAKSAAKPVTVKFQSGAALKAVAAWKAVAPSPDNLELVYFRDYNVDDGRYNNNGWLQEMPDPITKMTWDNAVLISRKTAYAKGLRDRDLVEIEVGGRKVKGPIWIQPGFADNAVGIGLGYGRTRTGRVGQGTGFNAYALRTSQAPYVVLGAKVAKTEQTYPISCTQTHWALEGRAVVREAIYTQYTKEPDFAEKSVTLEEPPTIKPLYPNPLDTLRKNTVYQWGMAIDLNACVGCSACVIACQSENNIPIVGKDQVARGREMQWMRIDRYYSGNPKKMAATHDGMAWDKQQQREAWIEDPQISYEPMPCQHCEAAPCENVCPVNATVHNDEGLNLMVYNRCVGTRYCSNNCPYKVRRFNYFDYNKRPINALYKSPLISTTNGQWEMARWFEHPDQGSLPEEQWQLKKLIENPDVTVRMRGVMEKCSYCIQRIEQAKIAQKIKAGETGNIEIPDGTIQTACQQACPAEAIVFGNIVDPKSEVKRWKGNERNYTVLEPLHTKPRTSYLARVRNPNPSMPDYYTWPMSALDFFQYEEMPVPNGAQTSSGHKHEGAAAEQKGAI